MAECHADAQQAFDLFFWFYDFPAEPWLQIRTTNAIELTFATVPLRTTKTRRCV